MESIVIELVIHSFIGPLPSKLHSLKAFFLGEGGMVNMVYALIKRPHSVSK